MARMIEQHRYYCYECKHHNYDVMGCGVCAKGEEGVLMPTYARACSDIELTDKED